MGKWSLGWRVSGKWLVDRWLVVLIKPLNTLPFISIIKSFKSLPAGFCYGFYTHEIKI